MNEIDCFELRISDEDIGSVEHKHKQHGHGFLHKHRHHSHPKQCSSSEWTETGVTNSGLVSNSVVRPVDAGIPLADDKSITVAERFLSQDMSTSRRASSTQERRNPFAFRQGNNFAWQNVNMTLVCDTLSCCFHCFAIEPSHFLRNQE